MTNAKNNNKKTAHFIIKEDRTYYVAVEYDPVLEDMDSLTDRVYDMRADGLFERFNYGVEESFAYCGSASDGGLQDNCKGKRIYQKYGAVYCDELDRGD